MIACVLLAGHPVLCIVEAYYMLFGVLFFSACEGVKKTSTEALFTTFLSVLEAVNQPPLSAGINFTNVS